MPTDINEIDWRSTLAEICGMSTALYEMMDWAGEPDFKIHTAKKVAKQIMEKAYEGLPYLKRD